MRRSLIILITCLNTSLAHAFWPFSNEVTAQPPRPSASLVDAPPLESDSRIFVKLLVSADRLQEELERLAPSSESGVRGNPVGDPVVDDVLEWNIARQPITVSASQGAIVASTALGGTVRIRGNVRLIRGSIGKLLGRLNPTNVPFSAHADLGANVSVTTRPSLQANWRLNPNLGLVVDLFRAEIPINHVGTVSVRGEVRDDLANKVAALQAKLNEKIMNDPFIEEEARKAQSDLCKVHEFNGGENEQGWLVVKPEAWEASQPVITEAGIEIGLGLRSKTTITTGEKPKDPVCGELAGLELHSTLPEPGFELNVPAALAWSDLSGLINSSLKDDEKTLSVTQAGESIELTLGRIDLRPNGDRVQAEIDFSGQISGFFGSSFDGKIYPLAKPVLNSEKKQLKFSDADVTVETENAFSMTGIFGQLAIPIIEKFVEEKAVVDLAKSYKNAKRAAEEARKSLNLKQLKDQGVELRGALDDVRLAAVRVTQDSLQVQMTASGQLYLDINRLK